jgi:imidazolonepropionase-like amidohydrolase
MLTELPGFCNSHVHFFERKWANAASIPAAELEQQLREQFTRWGFTTVFDLSSPLANTRVIRERIESGEVAGPRIFTAGEAMLPPGALPSDAVLAVLGAMKYPYPEISSVADAEAAARANDADAIKLFVDAIDRRQPGAMTAISGEAIAAAAAIAHAAGKPAFAHVQSAAGVLAALRNGVDVIAHTTPMSPWPDALLEAIGNAALTPTLSIWKTAMRHDRISTQEQLVRAAQSQLRAWREAGGRVLFGTDSGIFDTDPTEEYVQMAEAGMSWQEIVNSLTSFPVPVERANDRVVIEGDPATDIRALARVRCTIRDGRVIYRSGND